METNKNVAEMTEEYGIDNFKQVTVINKKRRKNKKKDKTSNKLSSAECNANMVLEEKEPMNELENDMKEECKNDTLIQKDSDEIDQDILVKNITNQNETGNKTLDGYEDNHVKLRIKKDLLKVFANPNKDNDGSPIKSKNLNKANKENSNASHETDNQVDIKDNSEKYINGDDVYHVDANEHEEEEDNEDTDSYDEADYDMNKVIKIERDFDADVVPEPVKKKKPKRKPPTEKKYICEICNRGFTVRSRLRLHTVTHTGEKPFSCDFCDQKFSHPTNKRRHMKTHTGDKPFVCLFCGKSFPVKHYLKDHLVKHTGERPHECHLCFMTFAHRFSLKQHLLLKHPSGEPGVTENLDERPFECEVCQKKFTQKSSWKIHMRLHTGSKPYVCSQCDEAFPRRDQLVRHKFDHSGERPYQCEFCKKGFHSAYILKQHRNVHTGDRRCQCETCGVELANKDSLARHMLRHSGECPHQCEVCNKKFVHFSSYKRHMNVHSDDKAYKCKECGKQFAHENSLNTHMYKHTAIKAIQCEICGNKFTYPSNLKRHMGSVHTQLEVEKLLEKKEIVSLSQYCNNIANEMIRTLVEPDKKQQLESDTVNHTKAENKQSSDDAKTESTKVEDKSKGNNLNNRKRVYANTKKAIPKIADVPNITDIPKNTDITKITDIEKDLVHEQEALLSKEEEPVRSKFSLSLLAKASSFVAENEARNLKDNLPTSTAMSVAESKSNSLNIGNSSATLESPSYKTMNESPGYSSMNESSAYMNMDDKLADNPQFHGKNEPKTKDEKYHVISHLEHAEDRQYQVKEPLLLKTSSYKFNANHNVLPQVPEPSNFHKSDPVLDLALPKDGRHLDDHGNSFAENRSSYPISMNYHGNYSGYPSYDYRNYNNLFNVSEPNNMAANVLVPKSHYPIDSNNMFLRNFEEQSSGMIATKHFSGTQDLERMVENTSRFMSGVGYNDYRYTLQGQGHSQVTFPWTQIQMEGQLQNKAEENNDGNSAGPSNVEKDLVKQVIDRLYAQYPHNDEDSNV